MKTRIPSAGTPLRVRDLVAAAAGMGRPRVERFQEALSARLHARHVHAVNSGTTAFYVILRALRRRSSRREVVLPAYTAPSLTLPIRKAGLTPRLCAVSPETLNMDPDRLDTAITSDTLCVLPVHMFGLACDIGRIRQVVAGRGIVVVEDAASSFGSTIRERETSTLGDAGFLSFNRGKNLSTLAGGAVVTADTELFALIEEECRALPPVGRSAGMRLLIKLGALALAVRPAGYTLLYAFIRRFKYTTLHTDFVSSRFPEVLAGAGLALLRRADALMARRRANGRYLLGALDRLPGLRIPRILPETRPVFNQFPLLIENPTIRQKLVDRVAQRTGVEITTLYPDPLHQVYDLGYHDAGDPFPNATFIARHVLLIPTHPLMDEPLLSRVARVITDSL